MRFARGLRQNSKVELYTVASTVSAYGEHSETFTLTASRWCYFEPSDGREVDAEPGKNALYPARFTFRYDTTVAALSSADRLKHDGLFYDIKSVVSANNRAREIVVLGVQSDRQS